LFLAGWVHAQTTPSPVALERYKQMLEKNPAEGIVLDRLWKGYSDLGRTAELLADFDSPDARSSFPRQMLLGQLLRKAGEQKRALEAFTRAQTLSPSDPAPALAQARILSEQGSHAAAAALLDKALPLIPKGDPRTSDALLQLGSAWIQAREPQKAVDAWERMAALDPANLELRRRLVDAYLANRLPDKALPHLDLLRQKAQPEGRVQALQQTAKIHQTAGRPDPAIAALEEALTLVGPTSWMRGDLQSQLIRLCQRLHRTEELEQKWILAAQQNPRDLAVHLQLLDLYDRLGEQERQLPWLDKLCALAPQNTDYQLRRAKLHGLLDQTDKAAALYDQLLAQPNASPELTFERARIDVQRGSIDDARRRIQLLLTSHPSDEPLRHRAADFFELHHFDDLLEAQLQQDTLSGSEDARLALARFYFNQKKTPQAREVLAKLVDPTSPPAARTAAHLRIAQILKEQGSPPAATVEVRNALALTPDHRDALLLLGELETAADHQPEARTAWEKAFTLSRTEEEASEADQKLFELLRNAPPGPSPTDPLPSRTQKPTQEPELADYLLQLTREAAQNPSVAGWLRIARWQFWNHSLRIAQDCAQRALTLDPDSIAAHEFLVRLAASESQVPLAVTHLQALIELKPASKDDYLRRIAQIQLESGQVEEALSNYQALSTQNPGNLQALSDLGLAQQRAEHWSDALSTWRQIASLTPPARRREATTTLLRIYARLAMPREAASLLLEQVDSQPDEKARVSLLHELLAHCTKHHLLEWLRDQFEDRRKQLGEDYFTEIALGRVYKAMGDKVCAFDLLSQAALSAPNQAEALPELIREAEELHRPTTAIQLQGLLLRTTPQLHPDGLEKLANLQEQNSDIQNSSTTWEKVVNRFPRDCTALQHAAEFQLRWGSPRKALDLYRRLHSIDPLNLQALQNRAELAVDFDHLDEARSCLEQLLAASAPERPGSPIHFPARKNTQPGRVQNAYLNAVRLRGAQPSNEALRALRTFWTDPVPAGGTDSELRLGALRSLATLTLAKGDPETLAAWVARWKNTLADQPSETLWALHHAGATDALLDALEQLAQRNDDAAPARQAFIWFALNGGQYARLASWMQAPERSVLERDSLFVALGEHLQTTNGRIDPALLDQLFNGSFRLWQAAAALTQNRQLRTATQLGERALKQFSGQRPAYLLELAHWHLILGELDPALRLLNQAALTPDDSLDAPVYQALRERYLLCPPKLRARFASDFLHDSTSSDHLLHQTLCSVVLHACEGTPEADALARTELLRILEMRAVISLGDGEPGNASPRHWNFLVAAGLQLQQWGLDPLAIFLWENALRDPALLTLQQAEQGESLRARIFEVRTALATMKILRATPGETEPILRDYARQSGGESLLPLAEALESRGGHRAAIAIYRRQWEQEPENTHALRNLINACRTAQDFTTLEDILHKCTADGRHAGRDPASRELMLHLADVLEERGELKSCEAALNATLANAPRDSRLLLRLALLHQRQNRAADAETLYWRVLVAEPSNGAARVSLANLLQSQSRFDDAIALLERSANPDSETKLVELYFQNTQREEAAALLDRLPLAAQIAAASPAAAELARQGADSAARVLLRNILSRHPEPRSAFPLQLRFLELLEPTTDPDLITREWRILRRMAGDDPDLLENYFQFQSRQASRLGSPEKFRQQWRAEWEDGQGTPAAGFALLEAALADKDQPSIHSLCAKLTARDDLSLPLLDRLIQLLADHPDEQLKARATLARINPADSAPVLALAQALRRAGRTAEAITTLEALGLQSVINPEIAALVAPLLAELGADTSARSLFETALAVDPAAKRFQTYLDYARFLRQHREFGRAIKVLRVAFRNPANQACEELVATLAEAGKLARPENLDHELAPFWLPPKLLETVRRLAREAAPATTIGPLPPAR